MNLIEGNAEAYENSEIISLADPTPEPPPVTIKKPKAVINQIPNQKNLHNRSLMHKHNVQFKRVILTINRLQIRMLEKMAVKLILPARRRTLPAEIKKYQSKMLWI